METATNAPTMTRTRLSVPDLGRVLAVWAHPDDETFLAGGTMAAVVAGAAGTGVTCVSATAGEHGTDDPQRWPPGRLGLVRRWESRAAMAVLGVEDHRFMGYEDGTLADLDDEGPVGRLSDLLLELAPDTILTFSPDGATFHPDHMAVSRWVSKAWRRSGAPGRLLHTALTEPLRDRWGERYEQWGVYMSDQRPTAVPEDQLALHVVLDGEALDQKVAALAAMRTQTASAIDTLGFDDFRAINAQECFVEVRP